MTNRLLRLLTVAGLAAAFPVALPARQAAAPVHAVPASPAHDFPVAENLLASAVRDDRAMGVVGAFGRGDRPTRFFAAGRGRLAGSTLPPTKDTLWRVYSMTKPVTGMAAMILIEEGRIGLDQPVADFIPAFRAMKVLVNGTDLSTRPATTPITIRHLLTHTSGMTYGFAPTRPIDREYIRQGIIPYSFDTAAEAAARRDRPETLQAFAERVATLPLVAEPGTAWNYAIGLDVLAAVIERVAHMPFERFVQTRLLTPLRMTSTYFTVPRSQAGRLADSVARKDGAWSVVEPGATSLFLTPPSFPYGGAALVSSARDYDRFLHMLQNYGTLDGVRIMKASTARLAMSDLLPPGAIYRFSDSGTLTGNGAAANFPTGFGAGGLVFTDDRPGWPGRGTFGWSGAAGSVGFVNPIGKYRVTMMVNNRPPERNLQPDLYKAFARDVPPPASGRANDR